MEGIDGGRTGVNEFELADDVQPNLWELILEKVEEQRKEMLDGSILPEEWRETVDLVGKCSADVLGNVLAQIPDTWNYPRKNHFLLEQL